MKLAQRYRAMPDYQLAQLAEEEGDLTPGAREVLFAEIARRSPLVVRTALSTQERAAQKDALDGLGGWLLWFCLNLFGAAYLQVRSAASLPWDGRSIVFGLAAFRLALAAWDVATGIAMVRRAKSTLWMIFVDLTAGACQGVMLVVLGVVLLRSAPGLAGFGLTLILSGLAVVGSYGVWLRYFQVSKRVRVTFGRNL